MAKDNNPTPNKFKVSPWLVYTAILLIFLFISFITGSSSLQEPSSITSSKFNELLDKGAIEKVIVYNKSEAEAEADRYSTLENQKQNFLMKKQM